MKKFNEKTFRFDGYSSDMAVRFYVYVSKTRVHAYIVPTHLSLKDIDMREYEVSKNVYLVLSKTYKLYNI